MTAVFADVCRKQGTLDPCIGRPSVKVQFDCLWWRADTDFGDVQCVVFDVFDLFTVSTVKGSVEGRPLKGPSTVGVMPYF